MSDALYPVQLYLTTAQLRKFQTLKTFQLRPEQISAGHEQSQAKHHVEIMLKKTHYRKLLNNAKHNKGFRFTPEIIQGGGILDNLKNIGNKIVSGAKSAGRSFVRYVPKNTAKKIAKAGLNAVAKQYDIDPGLTDIASQGLDAGVDAGYATQGRGMGKARMVKGSKEAKEWGARMKALQGKGIKDVGRSIKKAFQKAAPTLKKIGKVIAPPLAGVAGGIAGEALTGNPAGAALGATLAESATRTALGGRIKAPYGNMIRGVPTPVMSQQTMQRINTRSLQGGSFLPLGSY